MFNWIKRVYACWHTCKWLTTEELMHDGGFADLTWKRVVKLEKENDELRQLCVHYKNELDKNVGRYIPTINNR